MKKLILHILVIVIACAGTSCQHKKKGEIPADLIENPATATGDSTGRLPVFQFETTTHHFGEIKAGDVVSYTFKFKNTGSADLVILSAKASCGCTVPEYSKEPVQPGDDGKVDVSFDSKGKTGMVSKTVTLIANTIPNTRVLTISAEILPEK